MSIKENTLDLIDSFENPFEEFNANYIEPKQIVDYWCSPFDKGLLSNYDESTFRTSRIPIILQGFRGSGKTTILKYFSFPAQIERARIACVDLLEQLSKESEVGFYYRCDDSFVTTFKAVFTNVNVSEWTRIFDFYIELLFCKDLLEFYKTTIKDSITTTLFEKSILKEIDENHSIRACMDELSIDCLYKSVRKQIKYINEYKNRSVFLDENFIPDFMLESFSLSVDIVKQLKKTIPELKDVLFVFMFDEFENLPDELQRRFNSLIKFAGGDISLRIGRRTEGIVTNETVNEIEYLRENNDYNLVSLDKDIDQRDKKAYREYFLNIAQKRFDYMKHSNGMFTDLISMFGDKEDLDDECRTLCKKRTKHLQYILNEDSAISKDPDICNKIISIIHNEDNPIAETINALWVIRGNKDKIEMAEQAARTMKSYFSDKRDSLIKKYNDDYSNKYRYAITVFLCSVYKKEKLYYGFNALCYLSNGNPRTFINLCRKIISDAYFYDREGFITNGIITKEIQSRAIHNFARSEFDEICAIIKYGKSIKSLILDIGNRFAEYHKDKRIRYPETNQFYFDDSNLFEEDKAIIKTALSWSMINRKKRKQRITAGNSKIGDLYHINRVFSPIFNISYRTRGGVNIELSNQQIHSMLTDKSIDDEQNEEDRDSIGKQISVFDEDFLNDGD